MFNEYEEVRIKSSGEIGLIVDKAVYDGVANYVIEGNELVDDGVHGFSYPIYYCVDAELEPISA